MGCGCTGTLCKRDFCLKIFTCVGSGRRPPLVLTDRQQYEGPAPPPRQPTKTTVVASRSATKTYPLCGWTALLDLICQYVLCADACNRPCTDHRRAADLGEPRPDDAHTSKRVRPP